MSRINAAIFGIVGGATLSTIAGWKIHYPVPVPPIEYSPDVRYLDPPQLSDDHVGQCIPCVRPGRSGGVRMDREEVGGKVVYHNYGHAGSGWSMAPGSSLHTVSLFESEPGVCSSTPVTVVGAGVVGLFTAARLVARGYRDVRIMYESDHDLASHKAGGLISLQYITEGQQDLREAGTSSFAFFNGLRRGEVSAGQLFGLDSRCGAVSSLCKAVSFFAMTPQAFEGFEEYMAKGWIRPPQKVTLQFGATGARHILYGIDGAMFVHVYEFYERLSAMLRTSPSVTWENTTLDTFATVPTCYIFNCTGVRARELAGDAAVSGMGGHLLTLQDQTPKDYIVYLGLTKEEKKMLGRSPHQFMYYFPKGEGLLGGTLVDGVTEDYVFESTEFDRILKDARDFFYGKDKKWEKKINCD